MKICITIDIEYPDHPCCINNFTKWIEVLLKESISLTFFIEGRYAKANPWIADILKGQTIGNHGMFHVKHSYLTIQGIKESVSQGEKELIKLFGYNPKPLFRFPFGDFTTETLEILHQMGYKHCGWSYSVRDWKGKNTVDNIIRECQKLEYNTLLFHSWPDATEKLLIPLIYEFKRLKFEFVPMISSHMM